MFGFSKKRNYYIDELEKEVIHHKVDIDERELHYIEYGSGPLLVLIHGWNNDWSGFVPFMKELSGFHILALDLPGYGDSEELKGEYSVERVADAVALLLKKLDRKADIVCCLSMGTVIGVSFANKYPELLKKLVLIGPPIIKYDWLPSKMYRNMILFFNSNGINKSIGKKMMSNYWYGHLTAKYMNMYRYNKDLINKYGLRGRQKIKKNALFEMGKAMYNFHMEREMRKLTVRTLIILGRFDKLIDLSEAVRIKTEKENIRLMWVEDAGHVVSLEKPKEVSSSLKKFAGIA